MKWKLSDSDAFTFVEAQLDKGEFIKLERGSFVYHNGLIELKAAISGGNLMKGLGRSLLSKEKFFTTQATSVENGAIVGLSSPGIGNVCILEIDENQYSIASGSFLACTSEVDYEVQRQSLGKAVFAGTGGLFILKTKGVGQMVINAFGEIKEIEINEGDNLVVNTGHIVGWEHTVDCKFEIASGFIGFKSGEGVVARFAGKGKVLIQSKDMETFGKTMSQYIQWKT
ncbi:MAG: TIGR00266 family protein [Spiroplasma sp.]|nr:TIGR00266 family protein [Mycoplasmatales bacterium]